MHAGCPSVECMEYWTGLLVENASKCRTIDIDRVSVYYLIYGRTAADKTVVLKHSDYGFTGCSFHARQALTGGSGTSCITKTY